MNKKIKVKIIIIIVILISIIKIIQINFIDSIRNKVENFEQLNNIYYKEIYTKNDMEIEINIFQKENILRKVSEFSTIDNTIECFIDLKNNRELKINNNQNTYEIEEINKEKFKKLVNFPKTIIIKEYIIEELKKGNIASVLDSFRIIYIIPTKYKNTDCYKIKTTRETFYIDKHTLYPIYLEYNQKNSNGNKEKIKIEYIFKENTVTDEDVKLPDLSKYTLIEN